MALQPITLNLPDSVYSRIQRRASQTNRSVEAELLDVVTTAVAEDELSDELAEAITQLALLDDESLWRAARGRLPDETSAELESLHLKRQRDGLTESETQQLAGLVRQYERVMLIRSKAALLLKQRGYDVADLITQ